MSQKSNKTKSATKREKLERAKKLQNEKRKKEDRIMWMILAGILAVVLIAAAIPLVNSLVKYNTVHYDLLDNTKYTVTNEVTDLVKMTIAYRADNGEKYVGDLLIRLDPQNAPITTDNFQTLVRDGFYNGLTFHRLVEGLLIQGGDPEGTGIGGSGHTITGEFALNDIENNLKHVRGTISMARSDAFNSASSQFFIVQKDWPSWDGAYAAFGTVLYGMETVDGMSSIKADDFGNPYNEAYIEAAVFVKEVQQ